MEKGGKAYTGTCTINNQIISCLVISEWQQWTERSASVSVYSLARSRRARVSHPLPQLPPQGQSLQPSWCRTYHRSLQVQYTQPSIVWHNMVRVMSMFFLQIWSYREVADIKMICFFDFHKKKYKAKVVLQLGALLGRVHWLPGLPRNLTVATRLWACRRRNQEIVMHIP